MSTKNLTQKNVWIDLTTHPDVVQGRLYPALRTITKKAVEILKVEQATIWQMSTNNDELVCIERFNTVTNTHTSGEKLPVLKFTDYFLTIQNVDALKTRDVRQDPMTRDMNGILWSPEGIQSNLSVPVWVKGKFEGVIHFDQIHNQREWQPEDVEAAIRITSIVSQTLLTSDLYRLERRVNLVDRVIERINREEKRPETFKDLLEDAVRLVDGDSGMFYLCDPARYELHMETVHEIPTRYTTETIKYGEGVAGVVARTGRSIHIDNTNLWPNKDPVFQKSNLFEVAMACPVIVREETVGVLQVNRRKKEHPFDTRDVETLQWVANQAAVIVDYHHMVEEDHSFDLFQRVVWQTSMSTHLDILIENGITLVTRGLSADIGFVQVFESQATTGLTLATSKMLLEEMQEESRRMTRVLVTYDWQQQETPRVKLAKVMTDSGIRSSIIAQVVYENEMIGFIGICSSTARRWTQIEVDLLGMMARQMGIEAGQQVNMRASKSMEETMLRYDVVTGNLNHKHTGPEALHNIGNGAVHIFQPSYSAIYMRTKKSEVECPWTFGMPEHYRTQIENIRKEKVQSYLFGNPRMVFISNVKINGSTPGLTDLMLPERTRSIALCPLVYDGQVFGTLGLFYDHVHPVNTMELRMMEAYANQSAVTLKTSTLFRQVDESYRNVALMLAHAMDKRDTTMPEYSQRMAKWAEAIAKSLGCTEEELNNIRLAALLHDIGKFSIPDYVLMKPGALTPDEKDYLKRYPVEGERIIGAAPDLTNVSKIIRNEREHYDGSGYPDGKKGDDIPLGSRILAVVDAYGSITDDRPYQKARPPETAVKELMMERGKQFDPVVVDTFLSMRPQLVQ